MGSLPKPEYTGTNDEGTIVVEVLVDPRGRVVQANVTPSGSKGTAASNATLRSRAEAAAAVPSLSTRPRAMRINGAPLPTISNRTEKHLKPMPQLRSLPVHETAGRYLACRL